MLNQGTTSVRTDNRDNFEFVDLCPEPADLHQAVTQGLAASPRGIPPKFFYDEQGSKLFDRICLLPEYYPTRTELGILKEYSSDIAAVCGQDRWLLEPGSGSCEKVRTLLADLQPRGYIPIDISGDYLRCVAEKLADEYPELSVMACGADFTADLSLPWKLDGARLVFYPGSSIGNYEPSQAVSVLKQMAALAGSDGGVLIGVDLKKSPSTLQQAYDDAEGVTAAFNCNLLQRINRELGADFDLDGFEHRAVYDANLGRVEMHLVSNKTQTVCIGEEYFPFECGDSIHTENAYKYDIEEFGELARSAGLHPEKVWTDEGGLFSLHWLLT